MTQKDEEFDTLIRLIGKQFDYLYLSTKDMNNIYAGEYQLDKLPNDYILNQFIESLGFSKLYDFTEKNLMDYCQAINGVNYNKKDLSRYFKGAFINNITQVIKTKGTKESIRTLQNIFGWPEDLIQIEEYVTVSNKIPTSGFTYHTWKYEPITISKNNNQFSATGSFTDPLMVVYHFMYPAFSSLRDGTLSSTGQFLFSLHYPSSICDFKIDKSSSSFIIFNNSNKISATSSIFDYVKEDSVFALAYDISNQLSYIGYYNPIISEKNDGSITSSNIGNLYSITSSWLGTSPISLTGVVFNEENNILSENTINLGLKLYNDNLDINSMSSTLMNYETIKYKESYPTHWWKRQNVTKRGENITQCIDAIGNKNAIATVPASSELQTIYVLRAEEIKFSAGEIIDPIGIYVDDTENNISNYLLANNKLKIWTSPMTLINNFMKNLLNIYNIDSWYGNPDDLYKSSYSKLEEMRGMVYSFLSNYSDEINFQTFFKVLKNQYSENIIKFIINHLVPAKSNPEGGILIENDILDTQKYEWKIPSSNIIEQEDNIFKFIESELNIIDESIFISNQIESEISEESNDSNKYIDFKFLTEELINESNNYQQILSNADSQSNDINYNCIIEKDSNLITDDEINVNSNIKIMSLSSYEAKYLSYNTWGRNDFQGNEIDVHSITGMFKFGETLSNLNWTINNAYEEKIAHSEISQLNISWNKTELESNNEIGTLNLALSRFGNQTPKGNVKIIVPSRTETDIEPIITFSNIFASSGDLGYPSLSSANELLIKLGNDGFRHLNYTLNIPTLASSSVINAYAEINFGNLGPSATPISIFLTGINLFSGDAGNLLSFIIEEDSSMHTSYAKCEIIKNKIIKLSVIEVPYVVYNIIDALTSNPKINEFISMNLSDLYDARNSSTSDSLWMSRTIGEFKLQNGSGEMSTIKNKQYNIQVLNIYNNEQKEFSIAPRVFTIAVDENEAIKEQT